MQTASTVAQRLKSHLVCRTLWNLGQGATFVVGSDGEGEEGECAIWSKRQITF